MTAETPKLAEFTAALIAAHDGGTRFDPTGRVPETAAEAAVVHEAVVAAHGPAGGFKVFGDLARAPLMAPLLARGIVGDGARVPVKDRMGVELEVGFEVLRAIPAGAGPADLADCLRPRAAIELVDTRLAGPLAEAPMLRLADNQLNAGVVLGAPLTDWQGSDFGTVSAHLTCGAQTVLDGAATVPGGSALTSVAALAAQIGRFCGGLVPGLIIITGSLCGLPYFGPGTEVRGRIDGLGTVSATLV